MEDLLISEDPIGFSAGDTNLYRYVGNNATNYTDPSGELIFAPLLAWAATAAVAGFVGAISGAGLGFGMGAIGSLANDYDNGNLSIDSFGRAFQQGTEGAISGVAFGFGLGVTSAIPIVGNLAVAGILTHGAITGAERTGEAFGQGRYATGIFELGNAYLGVKAAGNHFGQGVADVQGSWQRGEIQSLARNTTSVIGEIWSNTGSRLFDRGYAIGETMPNGLIAGMGPGGAFKGEFENSMPILSSSTQPGTIISRVPSNQAHSGQLVTIQGKEVTFTAGDKLVPEIVSAIEASKPGEIQGVELIMYRISDRKISTDYDIVTSNKIFQVKTGNANGLLKQLNTTSENTGGRQVIGIVTKNASPKAVKLARHAGYEVIVVNKNGVLNQEQLNQILS